MIEINLENINNDSKEITFNKVDENTCELDLNIKIDDIKKKKIEKLDKAHRDMLRYK